MQSPPSRRRRLWAIAVLVIVALLAVSAGARLARIEREALHLAQTGKAAIALLGSCAEGFAALDVDRVLAEVDAGYRSTRGSGWREALRSDRDGIRVYGWEIAESPEVDREGLRADLARFVVELGRVERAQMKLDSVERAVEGSGEATVRALLWLRGRRGAERYEMHGLFRLHLRHRSEGWKIVDQELLRGETVVGEGGGFSERAEDLGIDFVAQHNPRFATPEWHPEAYGIVKYASAGVSAADYDGDGWYDLFFADGAAAHLFHNEGGKFREATAEAGLPAPLPGANVGLFADFDNDGDQDLFLGHFTEPSRLYRNEGDGTFADVSHGAGLGGELVTVAAAADYDGDGLLDLYVGRYLDPRTELPQTMFYTRNGAGNSLLRNQGGLRFADVAERAGVADGGLTLGVAWADYDADGDEDLYVANDFGRNALLENLGDGGFRDVSEERGALDFGFGMSAAWGDVDSDGDLDLYVSNIHSGQRWYGQATTLKQYLLNSLRQGTILEDYGLYREIYGYLGDEWDRYGDGMVKGNSLLVNRGAEGFTDVAEIANANPFGWYWGSGMLDFDNDGRLDIYAANGWITGKVPDDL